MTKEELLEFLKEHLKVNVDVRSIPYDDGYKVSVKVLLDDEEITDSWDYLPRN